MRQDLKSAVADKGKKMAADSPGRDAPATRLRGGAYDEEQKLTAREAQVLGCFGDGLGTEAIARRLGISRVTVRNHAQRILAKLKVHSRLEAVARGYHDGLIRRDD